MSEVSFSVGRYAKLVPAELYRQGPMPSAHTARKEKAMPSTPHADQWPQLPYAAWKDTCATLHLWTQIVGKMRLAQTPWVNHSWHVTLYLTARGLTTSPIPYGARSFQIDFDFIAHRVLVATSEGATEGFALRPRSVADFHRELMARLRALGIDVHIWTMPVEIADPV